METKISCRCCLAKPPDKDLKCTYTRLGKTEVYSEMLKECFEIHLQTGSIEDDSGICGSCALRLCDAWDFKQQVLQCQTQFQQQLASGLRTIDDAPKIKEEADDLDSDDAYLQLVKLSDLDEIKSEDDNNLAEMFGLDKVSIKRRQCTKKQNGRKTKIEKEHKSRHCGGPIKISLRTLTQMKKIKSTTNFEATVIKEMSLISENNKHKSNMTNLLKYSNCTPFSNKTLYGYVCAYCKNTYRDPQELRSHTQTTHKDEDFGNKRMDKSNISIKMDIMDLKCKICNSSFDVIANLKKHLTLVHDIKFHPDVHDYILEFKLTNDEIMNCALCHSTFETFKMLLQHMNGHYRNFICEECDMGFVNMHRLRNHKRTHEMGTFKCNFCDKVFPTRVRMMCHEKYTHNNSARYTTNCPHCEQSFTSYYQRNRHMFKVHNTVAASYKCNICDKSFILKSKLTSHIKKVHLMERNHICEECGQGFFIKQSLDEHMIKHKGERVHKCTVCLKAYARKKTLREHMRIHNNDRRFKCGVCSLAFVQKCSLKSHMLSNHGVTLSEYENTRVDFSPQSGI